MDCVSLADNFEQYFEIKFASTQSLREESFKIRHSVYCEELGWEMLRDNAMETDNCDDYSFALLLKHKRTGLYAGTARLVIPPAEHPSSLMPFEEHCLAHVKTDLLDISQFERGSYSEISRLAVPESFRRRTGEESTPFIINELPDDKDIFSAEERRNFPNIALGLYLSLIGLVQICHHKAVFVVIEPRLKKRLERLGLAFEQISDEMDYHGTRALFYIPEHKFSSGLPAEVKELYLRLKTQLEKQLLLYPYVIRQEEFA